MLRISQHDIDGTLVVKLEGKLLAPWVEEVRRACDDARAGGNEPRLDLSSLLYADHAGVSLLQELHARGARIVARSNYATELLKLETER